MKKVVVGSGTGANYPVIAGAIHRLIEDGLEPSTLVGTSGSTLTLSLLANGHPINDFLRLAKEIKPDKVISKNWNIFQPGFFHLDRMQKILESYVAKTFIECKIPLVVVATDSDTGMPIYFNKKAHPHVSVAAAVQASCSVPWLFRHVTINKRRYVDGGVTDGFAIDQPIEPGAIGIKVYSSKSNLSPWKGWPSFTTNMIDAMMVALEKEHIEDALWRGAKIIPIQSFINGMDFWALNESTIGRLYELGYNVVDGLLKSRWTWK